MNKYCQVNVPNAVLLVMDQAVGIVPESMNGKLVAATPTCVAVGTTSGDEGVALTITDEQLSAPSQLKCVYSATIDTPSRTVSICSVFDEEFASLPVPTTRSIVEVWVDHDIEPSIVTVVAGPSPLPV